MIVEWSEGAYRDYDEILDYLVNTFGTHSAAIFQKKLYNNIEVLKSFPLAGRSEFRNLKTQMEYRSLSCRQYRIVYSIFQNRIIILSLWNNRKDPEDLRAYLESR